MITEYFVCWGGSPHALQDNVNKAIAKGWQPLGGVAVSVKWLSGEYRNVPENELLYQAVVRMQEQPSVKADIADDRRLNASAADNASARPVAMSKEIVPEVERDGIYLGKVKRLVEFGAFVEVLPNMEGLLHIYQIAETRIHSVQDVLTEGDEVAVKVLEIDSAKMRLSRKVALRERPDLAAAEKLKKAASGKDRT